MLKLHDSWSAAHPMRVAVMCSRRAPGLGHLLDHVHRSSYDVVGVLTSDPECVEGGRLSGAGVSYVAHDIRAFCGVRGARLSDLDIRHEYDEAGVRLLQAFRPDLVVLCGYLHIVTVPLLGAYPGRIINIHDSDLPRFRGLHAVRDAVFAGAPETRSTIHVVTPDVDVGPALVRSWAFPTHPMIQTARGWGATDILRAYAYAHREWMMRASWGQLLDAALTAYADDAVRVLDNECLIRGIVGPLTISAREVENGEEECRGAMQATAVQGRS